MSNVLIGIIGVILFIGLALAGALILGDDFRTASADSKAAAAVQVVQQSVQAAAMYRLKTGAPVSAGSISALTPRFLKSTPTNPVASAYTPDLRTETGAYGGPAAVVGMGADNTSRNLDVCSEINEQTGQGATTPTVNAYPSAPIGCFVVGAGLAAAAGVPQGLIVVYGRI
jgi:hypothetical protein